MTTNLPPHQISHRPRRAYDDMRGDGGRISGEILLDGIFRLDICEFPHGYYHRHNLSSKFAGGG